jgi:hypothetical protein
MKGGHKMQMVYTYVPYTLPWDKAPVDISFIFEKEKPAGRHGFMTVKGNKFLFEDGTEMRFWGTNFNSGANFPEHSHSEKVARRLACMGVNIVRFHQLDAEWSTPNLFQFTKGPRCATTRSLDPRSLERLDYLIYCLKNEGIYIYLDMLTYRKFKSGDGVENTLLLPEAGKPYSNYSRRLIELQKEYIRQLWCHVNSYTGLAYKDDPGIVFSEITNENDMCFYPSAESIKLEPFRSELIDMWEAWADKNNVVYEKTTIKEIDFTSQNTDMLRFLCQVMKDYYTEIIAECRRIGVKIPITGTNWSINTSVIEAQTVTDFTDSHAYSWCGDQRNFKDRAMVMDKCNMTTSLTYNRLSDKPFFVSEWDEPWPSMYRADSSLMMAAIGMFQGWYGFTIHTYRYGTNENESVTSKIGRDLVIGNSYYRGIFDTYNDPAKFGLFYHAALIIRRGDVAQGDKLVVVKVDELGSANKDNGALLLTTEKHRVVMALPGSDCPASDMVFAQNEATPWMDDNDVSSDNGQLYRNIEKGYGLIDTPMTQAVYGFHEKSNVYKLSSVELKIENDFATVAISSLSDNPIDSSDNLLMTMVGRADNKDVIYHEGHTKQTDCGIGPVMVEVIRAQVRIKTDIDNLRIWSVDSEGYYTGAIPAEYRNGYLTFQTGGEFASMYYLIQAQ